MPSDEWKKYYEFNSKAEVTRMGNPAFIPPTVSPFVKKEDAPVWNRSESSTFSSSLSSKKYTEHKKKNKCVIS